MRRIHYFALGVLAVAQSSIVAANESAGGPALVTMKEIVVPIVDGSRAYGRLRIRLALLAHDASGVAPLEARMPELRETALIAAAEFARFYASPFAPVDAARLSKDISAAFAAHDAEHAISRVLLIGVYAERS